jgi:hypothetical protein
MKHEKNVFQWKNVLHENHAMFNNMIEKTPYSFYKYLTYM